MKLSSAFMPLGCATLTAVMAAAFISGCGSKSKKEAAKDAVETALTAGASIEISGTLADDTAASLTGFSMAAVDLSTLEVYCVTFENPPVAGTGKVGADGTFSLSLKGAQAAIGCFILKDKVQLASLVFEDSSESGMNGGAKETSREALKSSTNFGSIKLNTLTGKAVADVKKFKDKLKDSAVNASAGFDFSGDWKIAAADAASVPTGYVGPCPARKEGEDKSGPGCNGPELGMPIHFMRIVGKKFTADAACLAGVKASRESGTPFDASTCAGTTGEKDEFLLQGWRSKTSFVGCGSKLGMSYATAKAFGQIDLTKSGIAEGEYTFAAGLKDGWMDETNAVSNHPLDACSQVDYKGIKVYRCKGTLPDDANTPGFMINAEGGGCLAGDGKPVRMEKDTWDQYNWDGNGTPKANTPVEGLTEHSNTGKLKTDATKTITCTNRGGMFKEDMTAFTGPMAPGKMFQRTTLLDQGGHCASIPTTTEESKLAQLRCYANHFYMSGKGDDGGENGETSCRRRLRTDWSATKADQFIVGKGGPAQVENQMLMEKVEYTDANTASFRQEEDDMRGFPTKDGYVNCRMKSMSTFSMKKLAEGKLLVEMIEDKVLVDTAKADCKAESDKEGSEIESGRSKAIFLLVK